MKKPEDIVYSVIGTSTTIEGALKSFKLVLDDLKSINPEIQEIKAEKTKTDYILSVRFTDEFRKKYYAKLYKELEVKRSKKNIDKILGILKDKLSEEILQTITKRLEQTNVQNNE